VNEKKSLVLYWLAFVFVAVGMTASAALLVDYIRPAPTFCGDGGGCEEVRHTIYAYPGGVPLPLFGVLGFLTLLCLWMITTALTRLVGAMASGAGAMVAIFLIGVQIKTHHFCPYCMATDTSSIALAVLGALRHRGKWSGPDSLTWKSVAGVAVIGAAVGTFAWGNSRPLRLPPANGPIPDIIKEEIAKSGWGQVTVVDFMDFECPFCRMNHRGLADAMTASHRKIRLIRKMVPLERIHPRAMGAALAFCCAEEQGKGDAIVERLFEAEDISPEGCEKLAIDVGVDATKYKECLSSPPARDRIKKDTADFYAIRSERDGLPMVWIGTRKFVGVTPPESLTQALVSDNH
jgi:uncharacterized membrane protein/predicted DsbA family dithiol-disulfide isomerase